MLNLQEIKFKKDSTGNSLARASLFGIIQKLGEICKGGGKVGDADSRRAVGSFRGNAKDIFGGSRNIQNQIQSGVRLIEIFGEELKKMKFDYCSCDRFAKSIGQGDK